MMTGLQTLAEIWRDSAKASLLSSQGLLQNSSKTYFFYTWSPSFFGPWASANGGVTNGGLRGVRPPFLEIGQNRPFSSVFCLFSPFYGGCESTWEIQKTEEKGLFPQISSDLLKPPSLKPPGRSPEVFPPKRESSKQGIGSFHFLEGSLPNCWPHSAGIAENKRL